MVIGTAIGIALGRLRWTAFFDGWLILFLNLPALVTIVLCYIWFGLTEVAAILAVAINKIPNVVVTVREGRAACRRDLLEMAQVYRFGRAAHAAPRDPAAARAVPPAAARSGLALIWKIVLVVELLGRSNGVGLPARRLFPALRRRRASWPTRWPSSSLSR